MRVEERHELGEVGQKLIAEHRRMRGGDAAMLDERRRGDDLHRALDGDGTGRDAHLD